MTEHDRQIAKSTLVVAGATLVSRILGYARDVVVAFVLGAGASADAFFVAFRIPNTLRRLFGEGSLTMAFVPVYSRVRAEQGEEAAHAMARSALVWLLIILGGLTLVVEILAHPVTVAVAPGFADDPAQMALTVTLVRICFPYIILISAVALCMGILNSENRFLAPALAPVLLNVALIAAALAGYFLGWSVVECLAWGVLAGGVLQWLLQQPFLGAVSMRWRGPMSLRDPGVRRMAVLMLPTVFGAAVYQLNVLLGTLLASYLPQGSVSWLYYADRLVQFPLGVFGVAVSTAALPSLSRLVAGGDTEGYLSALRSSLGLTLFIALPSMAGFMALSTPLVDLLFGRGAFTAADVSATSSALWAYAAGLPGIAMSRPLVAAFYAREKTRVPVLVACACLVVNIGLGLLLMGPLGHVGLALAVTAASTANFLLLTFFFMRDGYGLPVRRRTVVQAILLSGLVFAGAWFSRGLGWWWIPLMAVWAALYMVGARLMGMKEARLLFSIVGRKLGRNRAA